MSGVSRRAEDSRSQGRLPEISGDGAELQVRAVGARETEIAAVMAEKAGRSFLIKAAPAGFTMLGRRRLQFEVDRLRNK